MKTVADFTNDMVNALRAGDPSVSGEIGTPERDILEAAATVAANSQVDLSVLQQQANIDLMTGSQLDSYFGTIFKFGRQNATSSVATVTFSTNSAATSPIIIPVGTQLTATVEGSSYPNIPFTTTDMGVIPIGETSVDVPVVSGVLGSIANVPAGAISSFGGLQSVAGISSLTNASPAQKGTDSETDDAYRTRFKNQFLRNVAGTNSQYLALAVAATGVSKANVVGPISRYVELIQVPTLTDGVNEVQRITAADAGLTNFDVNFKDENGTIIATAAGVDATDSADAMATELNTALQTALSTTDDCVTVTRTGSSPANFVWTITFVGPMGRRNLAQLTITNAVGGSAPTPSTVTNGSAPTGQDAIQETAVGSYDDHAGILNLKTDPFNWPFKATSVPSTIPYSKYTYPDNSYLTDSTLDPATANFFRQYVDYVFNATPISGSIGSAYATGTYAVGDIVRGNGTTGGGRLFICTTAGTAGGSTALTWNTTTVGVSTTTSTTGGVVFTYLGLSTGSAFQASHAYSLGDAVQDGKHLFTVTTAGTSDSSAPTWDTAAVGNTTDSPFGGGGATFTYRGTVSQNEIDSVYAHQPNVTFLIGQAADGSLSYPADGISSGAILLLEHQYMSESSRNSAITGVSNCIDVFVNGSNPQAVTSVEIVPDDLFQDTDTTKWTYQDTTSAIRFTRLVDDAPCEPGNIVQPLFWQPMLSVPDSITVANNTFYRANYICTDASLGTVGVYYNEQDSETLAYSVPAHYAEYQELGANYGTVRARNGIEWFVGGNPSNHNVGDSSGTTYHIDDLTGTQFSLIDYTFDQNIMTIQASYDNNKQTTTDPLVHRATPRYFTANITVMYNLGANQAAVNVAIATMLQTFFENQYFGAAIQLSDILAAIHSVPGVDNVRWTHDVNSGTAKIVETLKDGVTVVQSFNEDFYLKDNELPFVPDDVTLAATIQKRASGTWGS